MHEITFVNLKVFFLNYLWHSNNKILRTVMLCFNQPLHISFACLPSTSDKLRDVQRIMAPIFMLAELFMHFSSPFSSLACTPVREIDPNIHSCGWMPNVPKSKLSFPLKSPWIKSGFLEEWQRKPDEFEEKKYQHLPITWLLSSSGSLQHLALSTTQRLCSVVRLFFHHKLFPRYMQFYIWNSTTKLINSICIL